MGQNNSCSNTTTTPITITSNTSHCNVRTTENIAFVRKNMEDNKNLSIPQSY